MSDLSHISSSKLEIEASALWREINLPFAEKWPAAPSNTQSAATACREAVISSA